MLDAALNDFGKRMGLPTLAFSPEGLVALDVQDLGRLHFERSHGKAGEELLVYLARDIPGYDDGTVARALGLCHYGHGATFTIAAGLRGDTLLLLTRIPARQASAAVLENAVMRLIQALKTAQGA